MMRWPHVCALMPALRHATTHWTLKNFFLGREMCRMRSTHERKKPNTHDIQIDTYGLEKKGDNSRNSFGMHHVSLPL